MAAPPPTGCFKCGRPGHWSRDCPSSASTNPPAAADAPTNPSHLSGAASRFNAKPRPPAAAVDGEDGKGKKKKERATRPKLTPDLLLSDGGIGFVLRYFPKAFKPRARPGHEVDDLANLIKLYADWHSRLIPYYSFEQFVRKLEKLGAGNRVRRCVSELRDRVARGGDPTLLHEPPVHEDMPLPGGGEHGTEDPVLGTDAPLSDNHGTGPVVQEDADPPMESNDVVDPMEEDLLNEIYENTADIPAGEGASKESPEQSAPKEANSLAQEPQDGDVPKPAKVELTEAQKARMEANRLKALERAAARARASQQPT
ncbi:nucleic acid binding protein [Zea mays]|uniref:Nucleic acid binding protein n=1 Tax=Zea mays TaxID=4577 RepID=B4FG21_MAIZE|nr:nucleic acid binding protein [Zea mays]ACF81064.1 unknown [Zea mays]ACG31650.1 nucleic acid binding protein [Zea mays]ACG37532.1 nucleic acid binding protein [Zea mays]AQK67430.1 zinc knuckle (CCHC-type) family protein [Zea mays]|eukprot:NP_001281084.1 nucleic acid binding protein [Zea mays]